ncbi:MAG: hypothetical protein PWP23_2433 [Candidatus Sumerlaeota bacterium]|nr:hypothetical protein [Candidatus Sumerlaeota bacterium]
MTAVSVSPPVSRIVRWAGGFCLAASLLATTGCARLVVESTPPGATVLWSPSANDDDWRPWPPRAWDDTSYSTGVQTPLRASGRYGDAFWITVEKDGYFRPLPQPVQLYLFRNESLSFELKETPENYAARMRSEGLVLFQGEWVKPADKGLVEFNGEWYPAEEAEALAMQAKGLVNYKGQWLTPAKRDELFAADQAAAGLVLFKDRWVTPEVRDVETSIDERVATIAESDFIRLEAPRPVGRIDSSDSELQLVNSSSQTVRFLLSGPMSRSIIIEPYSMQQRVFVLPGRYDLAAEVATTGTQSIADAKRDQSTLPGMIQREITQRPAYLRHPLAGGYKYILTYDAGSRFDYGPEETYTIPQPVLPENLPTIEIPDIDIPTRGVPPGGSGGRSGGGGRPGGGGR